MTSALTVDIRVVLLRDLARTAVRIQCLPDNGSSLLAFTRRPPSVDSRERYRERKKRANDESASVIVVRQVATYRRETNEEQIVAPRRSSSQELNELSLLASWSSWREFLVASV